MTGTFLGCCARALSGQAAAPPISVMNSRRFMPVSPCSEAARLLLVSAGCGPRGSLRLEVRRLEKLGAAVKIGCDEAREGLRSFRRRLDPERGKTPLRA